MRAVRNSKKKWKSLFVGVGGVALADILANSVMVMIILIILALNLKREQEIVEQQQAADVSALLSRTLAQNAVVNDLPSSQPAYLHDYNTSPHDINPQFAIMPILELHDTGVIDFYTKAGISKTELFEDDNALDRFLRSLNPLQKDRIRLDVYSINLYYIVISILKDHGIRIRHWHFLGYDTSYKEEVQSILSDLGVEENSEQSEAPKEEEEESGKELPDSVSYFAGEPNQEVGLPFESEDWADQLEQSDQLGVEGLEISQMWQELWQEVLEGKSPLDRQIQDMLQELQELIALTQSVEKGTPAPMSQEQQQRLQQAITQELLKGQSFASMQELKEALKSALNASLQEFREELEYRAQNPEGGTPSLFSLQMPVQPQTAEQQSGPWQPPPPLEVAHPNFRLAYLAYTLDYLQGLQDAYDQKSSVRLDAQAFNQGLLQRLSDPQYPQVSPHYQQALQLEEQLQAFEQNPRAYRFGPTAGYQRSAEYNGLNMVLPVNAFVQRSAALVDPQQDSLEQVFYDFDNDLRLALRPYPALYAGLPIALTSHTLLLVPQNRTRAHTLRWRVVGVFDAQNNRMTLGYTRSFFPDQQSIAFRGETNRTQLNGTALSSSHRIRELSRDALLTLIYAAISLILVLAAFRRLYR